MAARTRGTLVSCFATVVLADARPVPTPGVGLARGDVPEVGLFYRVYRPWVAHGNGIALDRPDIRYAVKELFRRMS